VRRDGLRRDAACADEWRSEWQWECVDAFHLFFGNCGRGEHNGVEHNRVEHNRGRRGDHRRYRHRRGERFRNSAIYIDDGWFEHSIGAIAVEP
jgi:hypothetical protein